MHTFFCNQIYKSYPTGCLKRTRKKVLSDVTFQVEHREVFGIIGLNGAGKSTILKILMGFVKPDRGIASIAVPSALDKASHQSVGYLPEHPSLYPHLSLKEHLQFGCRVAGINARKGERRIKRALETVDLMGKEKIPIKNFSKGMTQRAALAYTILLEPEILILDEPMSGLDPLGRQLVLDIIEEYHNNGATILFCSHILTDVERICDRIGIMHQGKLASVIDADFLHTTNNSFSTKSSKTPLEQYFLNTVHTQKS